MPILPGDHHVHTRHSLCVHETYELETIVATHERLGFAHACVTDHVHRDGEGGFVADHVARRDALRRGGSTFPVYIGLELSLVDLDGRVATVAPGPALDGPLLFADHWIPGTTITMDDLPGSSARLKAMHGDDPGALATLYRDVAAMYVKAMERDPGLAVLAHPFDTFLRAGNFDGRLLDTFEAVCDACQQHRVAIELNEKALERYHDTYKNLAPLHEDCMQSGAFYDALLRVACKFDVLFSVGSDAHVTRDIGKIDRARASMASLGIGPARLLAPGTGRWVAGWER